jgi:hypothetical protein
MTHSGVGSSPPVQEPVHVAARETLLDVVGPGKTFALAACIPPVVVERVKGTPLGLPNVLAGVERRTRLRTVAVGSDNPEKVLCTSGLNTSQALAVLLPATTVAACDLSREAGSLEGRVEDFDEVCGLLAVRVHGGIGCGKIWLVQESYVFYLDCTEVSRSSLRERKRGTSNLLPCC